MRSNNVNAPVDGYPYGPRPGTANLNILQVQNSGQGRVNAEFFGIEQHAHEAGAVLSGGGARGPGRRHERR